MDQGERQEEGQEEETARKWTLVERNKDPHLDHQQNRNKEQTQWEDRHAAQTVPPVRGTLPRVLAAAANY